MQGGTTTARVYELRGLESRPHRVIVQPFGKIASVDVVAGELQEIDLFLNELGWIELDLPDGYRSGSTFVSIATAEPNFADRSRFGHSKVGKLEKGAQAIPVAPGTYIVSVSTFNGSDQPPLRSEATTVQAGATVAVELDALRMTSVSVVAEDVATGQPIALDIESWVSLFLVSAVTGEAHRGSMTFEGDRGSYRKIVWSPVGVDGLVRVIAPLSPLWTFEDLPPFELVEGATVTLRARAK